jgi:hypothetical protein
MWRFLEQFQEADDEEDEDGEVRQAKTSMKKRSIGAWLSTSAPDS